MFVDSLLNLSVKAVARCFCEARYEHIDFSLNEPISDLVFNEVAKAENEVSNFRSIVSSIISKQSGLKLNLTKFNSNSRFAYRFDMEHLHLHDIRSLDINLYCFKKNREFIIGYRDEVLILDAVRILKSCLNEKSRQNLREIRIQWGLKHQEHRIEEVQELIPNLQSFECQFYNNENFQRACKSFKKLVVFTAFSMNDLRGIRHLKSLQILSLPRTSFESSEGLEELFEVPNLRELDVSCSKRFFENLLLLDGSFKNLRFIQCDGSDITETQLRELNRRHKSLETISLLNTSCKDTDFSELPITVLNLGTIESTMATLRYSLLDSRSSYHFVQSTSIQVGRSIARLTVLLENKTIRGFKEEEFLKMMMTITLKFPHLARDENRVANCLISYFEHFFPDQTINVILKNLDPKSPLFIERRWAAQTILRYFEERHPI